MRKVKDYYKILGITPAASAAEISKAFKQAARRYHPDLNPGSREAEEQFKAVNEAHEVLSDPIQKSDYDRRYRDLFYDAGAASSQRAAPPHASAPEPEAASAPRKPKGYGFRDLGEIFEDVFGEKGRSQSEALVLEGNDILIRVTLSLEDAALGCERLVKVSEGRRVKAKIPGGVEQGGYVRLAGMGEKGKRGGRDGDLLLEIDIESHPLFERKADHLVTRVKVPLRIAIFGGQVEVPTLEGPTTVALSAGTQGNAEIRLRGRGAFNLKSKRRGDLLAYVDLAYTPRWNGSDREALRRLLS